MPDPIILAISLKHCSQCTAVPAPADSIISTSLSSLGSLVPPKFSIKYQLLPSSTAPPTLQLTQLKGTISSFSCLSRQSSPLCHTDHCTDSGSEHRNLSVLQFWDRKE